MRVFRRVSEPSQAGAGQGEDREGVSQQHDGPNSVVVLSSVLNHDEDEKLASGKPAVVLGPSYENARHQPARPLSAS